MADFRVQNCFECRITVKPHSFVNPFGKLQFGYDSTDEIEYEVHLKNTISLSFNDNDSKEMRQYSMLRHRYQEDGAPFAFVLDSDDGRIIKIRGYVVAYSQEVAGDVINRNIASVYQYFVSARASQ